MRRLVVVAVLVVLCGCTPAQTRAWLTWWQDDPQAAVDFLQTEPGRALLEETHTPAPSRGARPARGAGVWDRIAWCESGSNWSYPPVRGGRGQLYSGGLMIWTKAWSLYGGGEFAPQAWQASRAEQIAVAERILADRGWEAWDCA